MRTARSSSSLLRRVSASVHAGIHPLGLDLDPITPPPVVGLETTPSQTPQPPPLGCGPGDPRPDPSTSPPGVGLETPHGQTPQPPPPKCEPGDPPGQTPQPPLGVGVENPPS